MHVTLTALKGGRPGALLPVSARPWDAGFRPHRMEPAGRWRRYDLALAREWAVVREDPAVVCEGFPTRLR